MPDISATSSRNAAHLPRKPERANGRRRYEQLLDAAERLVERGGSAALTLQNLAREAAVPMASCYHFFPGPAAVSVALSERYFAAFGDLVMQPIPDRQALTWQDIVALLFRRAVEYYRQHPYAQSLLLGCDHSWHIRCADTANNRQLAESVAELIGQDFPDAEPVELVEAIMRCVTIADSLLALSIIEKGEVTADCDSEIGLIACAYLEQKFLVSPHPGSTVA